MGVDGVRRKGPSAASFFLACLVFLSGPLPSAFGAEEGGLTVIPDGSVIIQLANYIFLIVALNILLYRPIRRILKERRDRVKGFESAITGCGKTIQEKEAAFAKAIKDARAKGLKAKETVVGAAEEEERRLTAAITAKAQAEAAEIRARIAADAERVRASLKSQVDLFSGEIVKKILGRTV
jgi:F-type H+-transporting ATPase subunit b